MDLMQKVERWALFLENTRKFFDSKGFLEVTTPLMVAAGAFESCIDTLKVTYQSGNAELNSSPEIEMKALLAQIRRPIYQLAKSFRDDPPTPIHFKEFTMLEFYQPRSTYLEMKDLLNDLMKFLVGPSVEFREFTMGELVFASTGIDLQKAPTAEKLRAALTDKQFHLSANDTWDDMFLKLLVERVEPWIPSSQFTLVTDYPRSQAALAKINSTTGLAERFELYWKGVELANGCTELTDVAEMKERFLKERDARLNEKKDPHPYPNRLFEAAVTLPPCAGVAVGMDRLFLCLHEI